MIQTSTAYQRKIALDGRRQKVSLLVTLRNSYTYSFSNEDIMEGGISVSDGTSEQNSLSVGSFISRCLTVKLYNFDCRLAESQFDGSEVSVKIGLVMEEAAENSAEQVEWVYLGTFSTGEHSQSGGIITLTAYDKSVKFDRKYDSVLQYPATLYQILWDACRNCGVELANVYFANMDYVVASRPSDSATTYADIVSYVAQLTGCWARINNVGQLVLGWYGMDRFYPDTGDVLDGGTFSSSPADTVDGSNFYPEGEAVDGGTLLDCPEGDSADGGGFSDYAQAKMLNGGDFFGYGSPITDAVTGGVFRHGLQPPANISSLSSCTVPTEDVRITGVRIVPKDDKVAPVMQGTDDYVITIKDNPLAQGNLGRLLDGVAKQLVDFQFRPMEVSAWDNPSIEAGDVAYLIDPKGNRYKTIISNLTYEFGDYEKFSADAESKSDNQASLHSNSEKSTSALRADTGKAIDETNEKVDSLASDTTTSVASINENINLLRTNKVDTDFLQANYITAKDIKADYATVNNLTAATARISTLESTTVTADYLKANYITANDIKSNYATVENLNAANARIDSITSSTVTTDYLKAHYADISLSNITNGTIKTAMIETGAVGTAQIADGSITDAKIVELTADKITAGTLSVERLVITGSDKSIVYAINDANGTAQLSQTTVDGGSLTQRSITADRIVAGAVTAKEIAAGTITADKLAVGSITAESGVIGSIDASKITTGTISADRISSGILSSQNNDVYFDLANNTLACSTLKSSRHSDSYLFLGYVTIGKEYYPGAGLFGGNSSSPYLQIRRKGFYSDSDKDSVNIVSPGDIAISTYGRILLDSNNVLMQAPYTYYSSGKDNNNEYTSYYTDYGNGMRHAWGSYQRHDISINSAYYGVFQGTAPYYMVGAPFSEITTIQVTPNSSGNVPVVSATVYSANNTGLFIRFISPVSLSNFTVKVYYDVWGKAA